LGRLFHIGQTEMLDVSRFQFIQMPRLREQGIGVDGDIVIAQPAYAERRTVESLPINRSYRRPVTELPSRMSSELGQRASRAS
jgi:hypothetical protein